MISKDQLARFVRYLNHNHLANNKIRYFSTKRKNQIMDELRTLYEIESAGHVVYFIGKNKSLVDTKYMIGTKRWWLGGKWVSLPRSKPNMPSIQFKRGPFKLVFPSSNGPAPCEKTPLLSAACVSSPRDDDEAASFLL